MKFTAKKTHNKLKAKLLISISIVLFSANLLHAQLLWSSSSTWQSFGATKPIAGSSVTIPAGVNIILDETPPSLANLTILGKLEFAYKNLNLTAGWIMVHGTLQVGTKAKPFNYKAIITLNATNKDESVMGMGTRGIMVMGGSLDLYGKLPTNTVTKLNNHAALGSTQLTLKDNVTWKVNQEVVVANTDFYGAASSQLSTIAVLNNSNTITIKDALNAQRWGKLQYLTSNGMSLTPGTLPANITPTTPTTLDERAEVALLSRQITITSVNDNLWKNEGFGCHVMIMRDNGNVGQAHIDGVEIKRGGQAGRLGRYPFHWHMLSYDGSTTLPDITGQFISNSSINQSANRGIVIHGTNGAIVKKNVVYDVRGHGIFFENASERRNIIDGNIVMKVRNPLPGMALKVHESDGSSGFWISNPDNTVINNTATDCEKRGFWLAFPQHPFGPSAAIALNPSIMKFGVFKSNVAHSNQFEGLFIDEAEIDEDGNVGGGRYTSTSDMVEPQWPYENVLPFELTDYSIWKNNTSGVWNRSASPRNYRAVSADNTSKFFSGASDNVLSGEIQNTLVVGKSLNYNMNGVIVPTTYGADEPPVAFASYHSTFDIKNNVIVNFPVTSGRTSGVFAIDDYYLIPVDKGSVRNPNNIIINSHPGVRVPPREPQFTYGVVWDPYNYWGGPSTQDNYFVFDKPFFTYGLSKYIVAPSAVATGGVIVKGPFFGFAGYSVNREDRIFDKINAIRTTSSGSYIDSWTVEEAQPGQLLGNMRHFATHPSGYYYLDFPNLSGIKEFSFNVSNMNNTTDYQVIAVEYSGAFTIKNLFASTAYNMEDFGVTVPLPTNQSDTKVYSPVSSFSAVANSTTGQVYWQDKANNKVWFKIKGGIRPVDSTIPLDNDYNLYREFKIRAFSTQTTLQLAKNDSNLSITKSVNDEIEIYPNPASDNFNIVSDVIGSKITVISMSGETIKQIITTNKTTNINSSRFTPGMYIIQIKTPSETVVKKLLIK